MAGEELTRMPKPGAGQYRASRKLLLVPIFLFAEDTPEDGRKLLRRYWSEVRDHVRNIEKRYGDVTHIYHEGVSGEGDEGLQAVEAMNHHGSFLVKSLCSARARLEAVESRELLEEASDWQRCISIGLMSHKVMNTAVEGYRKATQGRYDHILSKIKDTLKDGETGVLLIRDDHGIQFPTDISVFYVAPPTLDALKRWMGDQMRAMSERYTQAARAEDGGEAEQGHEAEATQARDVG